MTGAPPGLIGIPQAPIPPGGVVEMVLGAGGARLRAACFAPVGGARGSVILSPGRSEPIEKYFEVIEALLGRGLTVLVHDWRRQGLSHRADRDPQKAHPQDWRFCVADYQAILAAFEARLPRPRLALAHSMGGCLVALALPGEPRIDAAVLTAPMFGLNLGRRPPPWLARPLITGLCVLGFGGAQAKGQSADPLSQPFEGNVLTHDRARWDRHRAQLRACPSLVVGGATWGWLDAALKATSRAARPGAAEAIPIPLLIVAAGDEQVVVNAPARTFAHRAPKGRYVEIAGSRHEIMMETDDIRARFWSLFDALAAGITPPSA